MERRGMTSRVQISERTSTRPPYHLHVQARCRRDARPIECQRLDRWFAGDHDDSCPIREIREICIFSVPQCHEGSAIFEARSRFVPEPVIYLEPELAGPCAAESFRYALNPKGIFSSWSFGGVSTPGRAIMSRWTRSLIFPAHAMSLRRFQGCPAAAPWPKKCASPARRLPARRPDRCGRRAGAPWKNFLPPIWSIDQAAPYFAFFGRRARSLPRAVAGCRKPEAYQPFTKVASPGGASCGPERFFQANIL